MSVIAEGARLAGRERSPGPAAKVPDAVSGNAGPLRAAMDQAAPAVRRFLFGMCGDWHQAEDAAQESLLKAWDKRETFDGRADPKTWIFTIARNCWLDRLRRGKARPAEQAMNPDTHTISPGSDPLEAMARGELAVAVEQALAALPPEQREALALRESEGLTFGQIAAMLDVPAATVKSRVRYALIKLAELLKAFGPESES